MKNIISSREFFERVNESENSGKITLKREGFNVLVSSPDKPESDKPPGGGNGPKLPPTTGVIDLNPPPPPKIKIVQNGGKEKLQKRDPNKDKKKKKKKKTNPGDEDNKKEKPQVSLPRVGQKVRLRNGEEATIKEVYPNGDIEI